MAVPVVAPRHAKSADVRITRHLPADPYNRAHGERQPGRIIRPCRLVPDGDGYNHGIGARMDRGAREVEPKETHPPNLHAKVPLATLGRLAVISASSGDLGK